MVLPDFFWFGLLWFRFVSQTTVSPSPYGFVVPFIASELRGSLSKRDGDGSENVI